MPSKPFSLVQISDCHLLAESQTTYNGINTTNTLQQVLDHIRATALPDLLLLSGDIAQDELAQTYEHLASQLTVLNCPILILPGNHDDTAYLAQQPHWQSQYWQNEHWQIIALDSNGPGRYQYSSTLAESELIRLDQLLCAHRQHAIIALHHPPIRMAQGWSDETLVDNRKVLQQIIQRHPQIKAVVWGHVHCAWDYHDGHIHWLSCPSSYALFTIAATQFTPMASAGVGYRRLSLYANGNINSQVVLLRRSL